MSQFVSQQNRNVTIPSGDGPSSLDHKGHDRGMVLSDGKTWPLMLNFQCQSSDEGEVARGVRM